jgi:hypothetical protein
LSASFEGRRRERGRACRRSRQSGLSALTLESPNELEENADERNKGDEGGTSSRRMFTSDVSRVSQESQTSIVSKPYMDRRASRESQSSVRHYAPFVAQAQKGTAPKKRARTKPRNAEMYRVSGQEGDRDARPTTPASDGRTATAGSTLSRHRSASSANLGVAPEHIRQQMMDIWAQGQEEHNHCVPIWLGDFVRSVMFDYISGALIMANALSIGVQADFMARESTDKVPLVMRVIELFFCVAFTAELILRATVDGSKFLSCTSSKWKWNFFDTLLVTMQITEELIMFVMDTMNLNEEGQNVGSDFTIMRILRILRLIRIMRLVRVLRFIGELRTIVIQIIGSMRSLCWTCALLVMVMYVVGVYLTQLVSDHMVGLQNDNPDALHGDVMDLDAYFGSLGSSILSLYQAITNGISWYELSNPLMKNFSPWIAIVICLYTAFAIFALFNIVTGVFVESALDAATKDKETLLYHSLLALWNKARGDKDYITHERLKECVTDLADEQMYESMKMYFEAINLSTDEHRFLFELLDIDGSGSIDFLEFVNGCFHLRGPAKALDLVAFRRDWEKFMRSYQESFDMLDNGLLELREFVEKSHAATREAVISAKQLSV